MLYKYAICQFHEQGFKTCRDMIVLSTCYSSFSWHRPAILKGSHKIFNLEVAARIAGVSVKCYFPGKPNYIDR